jgi:hypothetical protein
MTERYQTNKEKRRKPDQKTCPLNHGPVYTSQPPTGKKNSNGKIPT